jgi:hypothetical protein
MPQRTVPHADNVATADESREYAFCDVGVVTSTPDQTADGAHHVTVAETRVPADQPIPVIPPVHGDYYVPPEGTPVVVAYTDTNDGVVIGAPVPQAGTPDIEGGERILSHPLSASSVRFTPNGDVELVASDDTSVVLQADGTVVINNGTQGAVTDVAIDSTNSNGGATSLNVVRNPDVLL